MSSEATARIVIDRLLREAGWDIEGQHRFSKLYSVRKKLLRLQTETEAYLAAFTHSLLAKAFRGEL